MSEQMQAVTGQEAYEFGCHVGDPTWEELSARERDGWERASREVTQNIPVCEAAAEYAQQRKGISLWAALWEYFTK